MKKAGLHEIGENPKYLCNNGKRQGKIPDGIISINSHSVTSTFKIFQNLLQYQLCELWYYWCQVDFSASSFHVAQELESQVCLVARFSGRRHRFNYYFTVEHSWCLQASEKHYNWSPLKVILNYQTFLERIYFRYDKLSQSCLQQFFYFQHRWWKMRPQSNSLYFTTPNEAPLLWSSWSSPDKKLENYIWSTAGRRDKHSEARHFGRNSYQGIAIRSLWRQSSVLPQVKRPLKSWCYTFLSHTISNETRERSCFSNVANFYPRIVHI